MPTGFRPAPRPFWLAVLALGAALPVAAAQYPVDEIKTSIAIYQGAAGALGLEIRDVRGAIPFEHHPLSVSGGRDLAFPALGPLSLAAEIDRLTFERLAGGSVVHAGGFELAWRDGSLSLQGFVLTSGREPRTFELRTADGELVFTADLAHFDVDRAAGRVRVFNMDLRVAEPLARRLGNPALRGMAVGVLAFDARARLSPAPDQVAGDPCDDWSGDQDVALIAISSIGQTERQGGLVSITPSAALKNVGTANVPWHFKFSGNNPPYGNDQHPFLVWHLYRLRSGVFEQMAVSDVKHAFLTLNLNCDPGACEQGNILGLGCEDIYSEGTNESYDDLSLRPELTAGKGLWLSTGSHFDQDDDGQQDHPPGPPSDAFPDHRLVVPEAQLDVLGERYFFEAWYVVRDDINIFNTMGWREINPNFSGGNWSFSFVSPLAQGSALDAWVNPSTPGPLAANDVVAVADGHVRLAARVTDLGGGLWRYHYALMNHDYDPQVGELHVPIDEGVAITDITFRDIDGNAANDWIGSAGAAAVSWTKLAGPGLDWGQMYNFAFTADVPPSLQTATLKAVELTSPSQLQVATQAPFDPALFADGFESGNSGGWDAVSP